MNFSGNDIGVDLSWKKMGKFRLLCPRHLWCRTQRLPFHFRRGVL